MCQGVTQAYATQWPKSLSSFRAEPKQLAATFREWREGFAAFWDKSSGLANSYDDLFFHMFYNPKESLRAHVPECICFGRNLVPI